MTVSLVGRRPIYLQLRDRIASQIGRGEWKPGQLLPNEQELARQFGVSSGTVRKALNTLESEHVLTRRQGRGTFVNDQGSIKLALRFTNIRDAQGNRVEGTVTSSEIRLAQSDEMERARLTLSEGEEVYRIRRVRFANSQPLMLDETSMPARLFPELAQRGNLSPRIAVVAREYGLLLGHATERVSLAPATSAVASALRIVPNAPVMALDRVVNSLDGTPVEWRLGYCHLGEHHYGVDIC